MSRPCCLIWELTHTHFVMEGGKGLDVSNVVLETENALGVIFCCPTWNMVWVSTKDFLVSCIWYRSCGPSPSTHQIHWWLLLLHCKLSIVQYTSSYCPLVSSCRRILNHTSPFLSILHPGKDIGHRITKKCSVDCPETNVDFGMAAYSTKCCSTSLCNFSGANSIKISYAVMFLGIVASLICVIRAGLWWGVGEDVTTQEPTRYSPAEKPTPSVKCLQQCLCYPDFFQDTVSDPIHQMARQRSSYLFPCIIRCFVLIFPGKALLIACVWQLSDKIKIYVILECVCYIHTKINLRKQLCQKGL